MKHLLPLLLIGLYFTTKAQSYQANNEVTLFVKDKNQYYSFYSKALFAKINLETSEFSFQVDINTFVSHDTSKKISLLRIFPAQTSPFLSFKGNVPFNSLDKGVSNKQNLVIIGSLAAASQTYEVSLPIEFEFMDKQLLFHASFSIDLNRLNIVLPIEYRSTVSPTLLVRIDNGRFLKKE